MTDDGVMFIQSLVLQHHMKIMDDSVSKRRRHHRRWRRQ